MDTFSAKQEINRIREQLQIIEDAKKVVVNITKHFDKNNKEYNLRFERNHTDELPPHLDWLFNNTKRLGVLVNNPDLQVATLEFIAFTYFRNPFSDNVISVIMQEIRKHNTEIDKYTKIIRKNRIAKWGPYVFHGLTFLMLAATLGYTVASYYQKK